MGDDLQRARENADRIGRRGEELVDSHFRIQREEGRIASYRWVSRENAISPYDFEAYDGIESTLVEVKTTEGSFDNPIHVSFNELLQMRESTRYDLYRVFDVGIIRAKLRVSRNMSSFAGNVLDVLEQLPEGVRPDSVSVSPRVIAFEDPIVIDIPEDE